MFMMLSNLKIKYVKEHFINGVKMNLKLHNIVKNN